LQAGLLIKIWLQVLLKPLLLVWQLLLKLPLGETPLLLLLLRRLGSRLL
jgi:hypothetical protein